MNWGTIKEAIRVQVKTILGLADTDVSWTGTAAAAQWKSDPCVELRLRAPQGIGVDETRYAFDVGTDQQLATQCGPRKFTVEFRIESMNQEDNAEAVGQLSSNLRTRLRRPGVLAALRTAGVALSTIAPTVDADYTSDDRSVSAGVTEVVFLAAENDTDTTSSGDYIESVELKTTGPAPNQLRGEDEQPLPDDLQVDTTVSGE